MRKFLVSGLVLVVLAGLVACANSPQQLSPVPRLKGSFAATGHGQVVQLQVLDGRSSAVLGTRGGLYPETSTVSVPGTTLLPRLSEQVEKALRLMGFTPASQAGTGAPRMTVTLTELKYQSPKDSLYVTEAAINAVFRLEVEHGGRRYSGRYSASLEQKFGMRPDEEENNQLVSDVLSDALDRLFRDASLGTLLNGA